MINCGRVCRRYVFPLVVLLLLSITGCGGGNQSSIEGKLVNWKGEPVAGVKIVATQVQPIKGYEQFEVVSGTDGSFRIKGLYPSSEYALKPMSDKWTCETEVKAQSAPKGETAVLPESIVIDLAYYKDSGQLVKELSKQSSVEGKLIDGQGHPVAGVKVIATYFGFGSSVKGYEKAEATTQGDGSFRIDGLYPETSYQLEVLSDKFTTQIEGDKVAKSGQAGATAAIPEPVTIEFTVSGEVITDTTTGLDWVIGPKEATAMEGEQWIGACAVDGGGWRMPTRDELQNIRSRGNWAFKISRSWTWVISKETDELCEYDQGFDYGDDCYKRGSDSEAKIWVFGVRSHANK